MYTNIYQTAATNDSIINYAAGKPGTLSESALAECKDFKVKLTLLDAERRGALEMFTNARSTLVIATDDLKCATLQARRVLETVALGRRKLPAFPPEVKGRWLTTRIMSFAMSHLDILKAAGDDTLVTQAIAMLEPAMSSFTKAKSDVNARREAWKAISDKIDHDLPIIAGKLNSYKAYASYSVPVVERRVLRNLIKTVVPPKQSHKQSTETVEPAAEPQTVAAAGQPPALPAIPTVPVPQTGEHPTVSATA